METPTQTDRSNYLANLADQRAAERQGAPQPTEKAVAFTITDERTANWLLGKLASNADEQARVKAQADQRISELRTDYDKLMFMYGNQLEAFARAEAERRRRKTVTLQQGTVAFRTAPERFAVEDEEAATVEARTTCPEALQTVTRLDRAAYLDHAKATRAATGEILPGVTVTPERETFAVKFPKQENTES